MGIEQCAWVESFTIDRQPAISDKSQLPFNQCNVANILLPVLKTAVNTKSLRTAPPAKKPLILILTSQYEVQLQKFINTNNRK